MDKNFFKKQQVKKTITVKKKETTEYKGMQKKYLKNRQSCKVTFTLPKEAIKGVKKVNVIGDFNNWDKNANPLKKLGTGNFSTTLELASGRSYRFKYLVDNSRWENDFHADHYAPNPYGGDDSVVSLQIYRKMVSFSFKKKAKVENDVRQVRTGGIHLLSFQNDNNNLILHIRDTYSKAGEMITIQKTKDNVIFNEELFNFENFLLLHESSQQAFMNLSKAKNAVSKDELLDETKRLLQEHIIKQIKAKQSEKAQVYKRKRNENQ